MEYSINDETNENITIVDIFDFEDVSMIDAYTDVNFTIDNTNVF